MPLLPVVLVATLVVGVFAAVEGLRGRLPGRLLLRGLLALQLLLLVQAGVTVARLLGDLDAEEPVVFTGYLVLTLLLLPGALALTVDERTRYGTLVLGAGCLVVAVVQTRLQATLA